MGFDDILGHQKQKNMLLSFLEKGRIPHAFLFTGQDGIGKKKLVLEFTKRLFCEQESGCSLCRSCIRIDRRSHPDLIIIDGDEAIGIDQSRYISKEIYEYPYETEKRIILIDGAENMTHEARNALLKTLEEPPPFNLFFLVTSSEKEVPLTIRSRCVKMVFGPIDEDSLRGYFMNTLSMDPEKAELFSRISNGSIGYGLYWSQGDRFILRQGLAELILGKKKSFLGTSIISERITKTSKDTNMYLSFLLSLFRDLYCLGETGNTSVIINKDLKGLMERKTFNFAWINGSIRKIEETAETLRYNVNKWLVFENLVLNIMESA